MKILVNAFGSSKKNSMVSHPFLDKTDYSELPLSFLQMLCKFLNRGIITTLG